MKIYLQVLTFSVTPQTWLFHVVIPPNSNTFSDWRRTCHVSLVKTSWRPRANKTSWRPRATTTWTFDSHVIRSCTFETAANLYASRRQASNFYLCIVLFWVGRYNKTLNDWPLGKQWVLFPLDLNVSLGLGEHWGSRGNKTHCFPWGQSLSAYCCFADDGKEMDKNEKRSAGRAKLLFLPTEHANL